MVDFFASLRQIAEGRMGLGVGQVEGLGGGRDRTDEALPHLQLGKVDGALVQTFGCIELENAIGAKDVDGAHFRNHVLCDLAHNLVQTLLRLKRLRQQFAQPLEENARTRREVSHRVPPDIDTPQQRHAARGSATARGMSCAA